MFVLYSLTRHGDFEAPREVVVSAARVEVFAESFATTWMRPPWPSSSGSEREATRSGAVVYAPVDGQF